MQYLKPKHQADTLGEFLWKVALYMRYGYLRYAVRTIPEGKEFTTVDENIQRDFSISRDRMERMRRRKKGLANVVFVRFNYTVIRLATDGTHELFDKIDALDFRQNPLQFSGYSIGIKGHKPYIKITARRFKAIRKQVQGIALHNHRKVTDYVQRISPFSFSGVADQRWKLLKEINRRRKKAGLPRIQWEEAKKTKGSERFRR